MIVDTVAGILVRKGKVLVEKRRRDDSSDPGLVVIPGGHVKKGESLEKALKREMREELGIRVEETGFLVKRLYTASDDERQRIHYFHVEKWKGRIRSREAERVYWESRISRLSDVREQKVVGNILREYEGRKGESG
jgi:mutator protein MutT